MTDPFNPLVRSVLRGWLALALVLAVSGCASLGAGMASQVSRDDYGMEMAAAEVLAAAGEIDAALLAFKKAAALEPARKQPWLRIAHLHADGGQPALAMLAASKVLQRDPSDADASALYMASGLQIAIGTVQRLRAGSAEQQAGYQPQVQALVEALAQVYAVQDILPSDVRQRLAKQAVEQWKQDQPKQIETTEPPPSSPLDILGGD